MYSYRNDKQFIAEKSKEYRHTIYAIERLEHKLRLSLDSSGELVLERLLEQHSRLLVMVARENRIQGFRMGIEAMSPKEGICESGDHDE